MLTVSSIFRTSLSAVTRRWATNLGGGSSTNGRDSAGKRLGIKLGNGAKVKTGQIIIRQRGFQYHPGDNIGVGRDHTLWAKCDGNVAFSKDYWKKHTIVSVMGKTVPAFGAMGHESFVPETTVYPTPERK